MNPGWVSVRSPDSAPTEQIKNRVIRPTNAYSRWSSMHTMKHQKAREIVERGVDIIVCRAAESVYFQGPSIGHQLATVRGPRDVFHVPCMTFPSQFRLSKGK